MPLQRLSGVPQGLPLRLVQTVAIDGEPLYLAAQQCAALPARLLRQPLRSVAEHQGAIRDALDAVNSGV
jgi:toxin CcdB